MNSGSRFKAASEWSARFLLIAAAIAVIGYVVLHLLFVVVPFVAALLIASLLTPPANYLRRRGWRPGLATAAVLVVAIVVVAGLIAMVGPPVASRFGQLGDEVQNGIRSVQHWLTNGPLHLSPSRVNDIGNSIVSAIRGGGHGGSAVTGALHAGMKAAEFGAGIVLGFVMLIFLIKDGRKIWNWLVELVPARARPRARQIGEVSWEAVSQYVHGIIMVAAFDAVFIGIGLAIIGVPLVLPLMVVIFITAFIPFVGAWVSGAIATLIAVVTVGVLPALGVVITFVIVNQIESHVFYPVVVGRRLRLHPLAVIVGVAIGGSVLGILGALFSVPIVAVIGRLITAFRAGPPPGPPEHIRVERRGDVDVVLLPPNDHQGE